jgi:leucyl-tRNA synthetase
MKKMIKSFQKTYRPWEIESKWQKIWTKKSLYKAVDFSKKPKFYALVEFPYPSGEGLHMGHVFTGTILDIFARKKMMEGFNVLYPMGWDAFGLPTENYAIRTGIHPEIATKRNTDSFRAQNKRLAMAYDWRREIDTTHPAYYHWTQWIFIQLFKYGLAYKAETPVGWCPACKIILANEEIVNGACERCGHQAEYRMQKQWLLEITQYADRLIDDLAEVDYPEYVKTSQRNWIGRTYGVDIKYPIVGKNLTVSCYSTRPDTNFGATFVVIAPEHPLVPQLVTPENTKAVNTYVRAAKKKSELERTELVREKTGVFSGSYALNCLNGRKMPIYVSDFVVLTAGTGVVVGVPAHDQKDFEFAKKYALEIVPVVKPKKGKWEFEKSAFIDIDEAIVFNSDFLNGLPALEAKEEIIDYLVKKKWGKRAKNYHLRDWIFSRQHYWGEPIPMIFCSYCRKKRITWWETKEGKQFLKKNKLIGDGSKKGDLTGWFPVAEKDLPVELPKVEKYQPTNTGESPLANVKKWVEVKCPECGGVARRETDTMPNWAGSSWYFLRFCDPKNKSSLADFKKLKYWLPVDLYLGGAEHTTLHLLYSRFWHKFLNDTGVVSGREPYASRRQHGVILGEDGYRMSKSRGNVINPEDVIEKFGADTLRVYLMFMGPYESTMPWSTKGLEGCYRFLTRVWRIFNQKKMARKTSRELSGELHRLIKKINEDIELLKHNTTIAAMMEFLNNWSQQGSLSKKDAGGFLKLLAPFAPHLAEELWVEGLGNKFSVHQQSWPKFNPKLIEEEMVTVVIQVNGRVRGQIEISSQESVVRGQVEKLAKKEKNVTKYLAGKKIKKTIFVPGKLINFVV